MAEKKMHYLMFTILSGLNYLVMIALPISIQKLVDNVFTFNKNNLSNLVISIVSVSAFYIISYLFL